MQLDHTHPVLAGAGYHLPLRGALLGQGAGQRRARRCGPFPSGQTPRGPHTSAPELSGEPKAQCPQARDTGRWRPRLPSVTPARGPQDTGGSKSCFCCKMGILFSPSSSLCPPRHTLPT